MPCNDAVDDADDTNVLMMLIPIPIQLPFADDDDGNAVANNAVANEDDSKPANRNELRKSNKMPKQERRIQPISAGSLTIVTETYNI